MNDIFDTPDGTPPSDSNGRPSGDGRDRAPMVVSRRPDGTRVEPGPVRRGSVLPGPLGGHRRAIAAAAGGVALLALFGLLVGRGSEKAEPVATATYEPSGVYGDLDGDGTASDAESDTVRETERQATAVLDAVFVKTPKPGAGAGDKPAAGRLLDGRGPYTDLLLTPAGTGWWDLVLGEAVQINLLDTPAPADATWYAVTTADAPSSLSDLRAHQALMVKFSDPGTARTWIAGTIEALDAVSFQAAVREDGLAILTPPWVTPAENGYAVTTDKSTRLDDQVPTVGIWQIDFDARASLLGADTGAPRNHRALYTHLGLGGGDTYWRAISPTPDTAWSGDVTGFDAESVDADAVVETINSFSSDCASLPACARAAAAQEAIYEMYVRGPEGTGGGIDDWVLPGTPGEAAFYLGFSPAFDSVLTGSRAYPAPANRAFTAWWVVDSTLTIQPVFERG